MKCTTCNAKFDKLRITQADGAVRTVTGCPHHWRFGEIQQPPAAKPAKTDGKKDKGN